MRGCIGIIGIALCAPNFAQRPTFEAASIRPASGQPTLLDNGATLLGRMEGGPGTSTPERFSGNGVT